MATLMVFQVARLAIECKVAVRSALSDGVLLFANEAFPDQRHLNDLNLAKALSHLNCQLVVNVFNRSHFPASPSSLNEAGTLRAMALLSKILFFLHGKLMALSVPLFETIQLRFAMAIPTESSLN